MEPIWLNFIKKNYKVYGILRRSSLDPLSQEFLNIRNKIEYINLDLSENLRIIEVIKR